MGQYLSADRVRNTTPWLYKVETLSSATKTVTADDSGTIYLLARAGGIDVALPELSSVEIGAWFEFHVVTPVSGDAYTITAQAGDLLTGIVTLFDTDTSNAPSFARPDGSDDLIVTLNATTSGGGVSGGGDMLRFVATSATSWRVSGTLLHTSNVATPFS